LPARRIATGDSAVEFKAGAHLRSQKSSDQFIPHPGTNTALGISSKTGETNKQDSAINIVDNDERQKKDIIDG